jgi:hypothetical protein
MEFANVLRNGMSWGCPAWHEKNMHAQPSLFLEEGRGHSVSRKNCFANTTLKGGAQHWLSISLLSFCGCVLCVCVFVCMCVCVCVGVCVWVCMFCACAGVLCFVFLFAFLCLGLCVACCACLHYLRSLLSTTGTWSVVDNNDLKK